MRLYKFHNQLIIVEVYYDNFDKCKNIIVRDGYIDPDTRRFSDGEIFRYEEKNDIVDIKQIKTLKEAIKQYPEYFL